MRIRHADMLMRLLLVIAIAMPVRLSVCGCCGSDTADPTEPTSVRETADRAPSTPSCCSGRAAHPDQAHGIVTGPTDSGDRLPGDDDDGAPCDDCNCPLCPAAVHAPIFKPFTENAPFAAPVLMGTIRPTTESAEIAAHIRRLKRPPRPVSIHA